MISSLPEIWLVRHGETEWSVSGQHTGRTDIPLTAGGQEAARRLGARLVGRSFSSILCSPSERAFRTSVLAGFGVECQKRADLAEWDYGAYEGVTTKEIIVANPGWKLFRDGCPGGETAADVGTRADRVIAELRSSAGDVLIFSSAHIMRVLAARWLGLPADNGALMVLNTASISVLGYEHDVMEPVLRSWNVVHASR